MHFHLLIDVSANTLVVNQPLYHRVFSLNLRLSPSNATDGIEGDIPSSVCQFELDSLESGVSTSFLVWSVVTVTSDLSMFRFL